MKRLFVFSMLGGLLVLGLSAANAQKQKQDAAPPKDGRYARTDAVELHRCRIKLKKQAILASDRPGILEFIASEEGDKVAKGDVVAGLKSDIAKAAYAVAQMKSKDDTEIEYAKKARDQAKVEVEKSREVNRNAPGTISQIEIQRQVLEWEKAKASVKKAEMQKQILAKEAEEAKAQLDSYNVVAPFNGRVAKRIKTEGEAVRQGDPIIEIVNTDTVVVEGYIDYRDRPLLAEGNIVFVQLEETQDPNEVAATKESRIKRKWYPGKLIFIDETVQTRTKRIFVKAEVANPEKLLFPGLTAVMKIRPGTKSR